MNVDIVQNKKRVEVLDHTPAVVSGWRLSFSLGGISHVEPSFATALRGRADDAIHGVALLLPRDAVQKLDRQEGAYDKTPVIICAYDGRELHGWMYTSGWDAVPDVPCSKRYLALMIRGAREAGVRDDYVQELARRPHYTPDAQTLERRRALPIPDKLPSCTVQQLAATKGGSRAYVSILGFVLETPRISFQRHEARDITARQSRQWRGVSMDEDDDHGRMPMVEAVADMPADQVEFVWQWMDHYLHRGAECVAYLEEFREQNPNVHPLTVPSVPYNARTVP